MLADRKYWDPFLETLPFDEVKAKRFKDLRKTH
jgi:hypothetical protein